MRPARSAQARTVPGKTVVQRGERAALCRVALAHHLGQPKGPELGDRGASQPPACDGRELAGVADRDHLRAYLLGSPKHALAGAGAPPSPPRRE